jgi:hypothetical protein
LNRNVPEAWVLVVSGLLWLGWPGGAGFLGMLLALLPGGLLLATGVSLLFWIEEDRRVPQFAALGAFLGIPFALPSALFVGLGGAVVLAAASFASLLAAGATSLRLDPPGGEVRAPSGVGPLAAKVAVDDAVLANTRLSSVVPHPGHRQRIREEMESAIALFRERGWLEKPEEFHTTPPALEEPSIRPVRRLRLDYEHLQFDSGYEPRPEEPGRDRWLELARNRTAHAFVLRHSDAGGPWLLCIHGYRMGYAYTDLPAFEAHRLHRERGLNVVCATLPLHGPRRVGRRSGDGFLTGDLMDTVHAEAQSMWDLRRILGWMRGQGAGSIGVYGLSLGGYNTALLAGLESDLACAISGIPATDFTDLTWRHGSPRDIREAEETGVNREEVSRLLSVVSPLSLSPRVAPEARFIFAGTADRLAPPDQARALWEHWGRPRIAWYPGTHLSFRRETGVRRLLDEALARLEPASG